jgi:4-hydroxybenzoate polyprenyltransferase
VSLPESDKTSGTVDNLLPDAVAGHFLWRWAPEGVRPFVQLARLDRPVGWQLLLAPCWFSTLLASSAMGKAPDLWLLFLFFVGAVAMRGAGSTYNDLVDRDIDAKVERTRGRPLPSGRVTPRAAVLFFVAQCLVGLAVLLSLNPFTVKVTLASVLIVLIYPFAKRFTSWPQAVLGCAFAYGALVGWAAETGALSASAFLLYGSSILWTIGYDTIYALQDINDDEKAGIRSTARTFGPHVRFAVGALYLGSAALAALAVALAGGGWIAQAGVAAFAAHLAWQTTLTDARCSPATALTLFRSNRDAALLLVAGLFGQSLLRVFYS